MGLTEFHKNQQEKTDLKIFQWMTDFSINEPRLVDSTAKKGKPENPAVRSFWINGISRGTKLDKETVRKSVERLIEKELIWERPKTTNVRMFRLSLKDWKKQYQLVQKYGGIISPKIPRGDDKEREMKRRKVIPKMKRRKKKISPTYEELKKMFSKKKIDDIFRGEPMIRGKLR